MFKEPFNFAYCAGYLDGDGCFYLGKTIQKPKNIVVYEYSIQVLSVKKEVLYDFQSAFGGYVRIKEKRLNHKIPYQWTIKGQHAAKLAENVLSFLLDKKIACSLFIEMSNTISPNYWRITKEETIRKREEIIKQIKEDRDMNNFVTKESIEALKGKENTITPEPKDFAYLAGLIDSEGCFRVKHWKPKNKPNQVYAINLEIGNTKLPIIPWLIERFGGNVVFVESSPRRKAFAVWSLSSKSLFEILPKIHRFLRSKKEVCEKLMEFQQTIIPNGGDRHSELFNALFTRTRAKRDQIIEEIHKLNAKGS